MARVASLISRRPLPWDLASWAGRGPVWLGRAWTMNQRSILRVVAAISCSSYMSKLTALIDFGWTAMKLNVVDVSFQWLFHPLQLQTPQKWGCSHVICTE